MRTSCPANNTLYMGRMYSMQHVPGIHTYVVRDGRPRLCGVRVGHLVIPRMVMDVQCVDMDGCLYSRGYLTSLWMYVLNVYSPAPLSLSLSLSLSSALPPVFHGHGLIPPATRPIEPAAGPPPPSLVGKGGDPPLWPPCQGSSPPIQQPAARTGHPRAKRGRWDEYPALYARC